MASAMMSTPAFAMRHSVRGSRAVPAQAVRPARAAACRAVKPSAKMSFEDASKAVVASAMATTFAFADSAAAAQEIGQIAADNRIGVLAALAAPVVAWVAFNIAVPATRQLENMQDKPAPKPGKKRGIVAGLTGLAAAAMTTPAADAAQEVAQLAADNRIGVLVALAAPVVAWVAFNIAVPATRQIENMQDKPAPKPGKKR